MYPTGKNAEYFEDNSLENLNHLIVTAPALQDEGRPSLIPHKACAVPQQLLENALQLPSHVILIHAGTERNQP